MTIEFQGDGRNKSVGWRLSVERASSFEFMHDIFKNSEYGYSQLNRNAEQRSDIPQFHYFVSTVSMNIDGKERIMPVKLFVREMIEDGNVRNRYYYHTVATKNNGIKRPVPNTLNKYQDTSNARIDTVNSDFTENLGEVKNFNNSQTDSNDNGGSDQGNSGGNTPPPSGASPAGGSPAAPPSNSASGTTASSTKTGQKEWASDDLTREVISRASGTTPNGIKTDQSVLPKIDYNRVLAEGTQRPYVNKNAYTLTQKARVALVDKDVRKWLKSLGEIDRDDPSFQVKIINIFVSAVYVWDDRFVVLYNVFSDGVAVTGITIDADVVDEEFGVHPEDTKVRQIQQCHVVFAELLYVPEPLLYL